MRLVLVSIIALPAAALCPIRAHAGAAPAETPDEYWSSHVEPLLDKQCLKCHAGVRQQGGLDLRSLDTILRGGEQGPAIIPGRPNESRMLQYVLPKSEPHMPLDSKRQLSADEIAILKTWISMLPAPKSKLASGTSTNNTWTPEYLADYRRAYQSHEIPPPGFSGSAAVDWFLQTDWKRAGIDPARQCEDAAFARRITLDLAGRIPSKDELKQFLADARGDKK